MTIQYFTKVSSCSPSKLLFTPSKLFAVSHYSKGDEKTGRGWRKSACDSKNRNWRSFNHLQSFDLFMLRANDVSESWRCIATLKLLKSFLWCLQLTSVSIVSGSFNHNHSLINPNCLSIDARTIPFCFFFDFRMDRSAFVLLTSSGWTFCCCMKTCCSIHIA